MMKANPPIMIPEKFKSQSHLALSQQKNHIMTQARKQYHKRNIIPNEIHKRLVKIKEHKLRVQHHIIPNVTPDKCISPVNHNPKCHSMKNAAGLPAFEHHRAEYMPVQPDMKAHYHIPPE